MLVGKMAQAAWLSKRALILQQTRLKHDARGCWDEKGLALYIRYQTTHDRAFYKSLNELLRLRAEKRKEQIGFESQSHKQADQTRRAAPKLASKTCTNGTFCSLKPKSITSKRSPATCGARVLAASLKENPPLFAENAA